MISSSSSRGGGGGIMTFNIDPALLRRYTGFNLIV